MTTTMDHFNHGQITLSEEALQEGDNMWLDPSPEGNVLIMLLASGKAALSKATLASVSVAENLHHVAYEKAEGSCGTADSCLMTRPCEPRRITTMFHHLEAVEHLFGCVKAGIFQTSSSLGVVYALFHKFQNMSRFFQ
eukprot:Gb_31005 [translate_table: standard]